MAKTDWLAAAREVKRAARARDATEVFLQPIFKGKTLVLEYRDLKLRVRGLDAETIQILQRSSVPRFLYNSQYKDWGSFRPKQLFVHGRIVRSRKDNSTRRFIATSVSGADDKQYHNQLTSIHLLFARGFYTPLAQSSWMKTEDVQPKTLKKRLAAKAELRVENIAGKAFSALSPIGLRAYDCIAVIGKDGKKRGRKVKKKSGRKRVL